LSASDFRFRKTFADLGAHPFLVVRLITSAIDEPLHCIKQFHPIFQRRLWNGPPNVKTLRAMKKLPVTLNALDINLKFFAILGFAFPTDFGLGHGNYSGKFTLVTAIAAMPSSRPMKPISSFVVALMPTCASRMPSASAMCLFIAAIYG